MIDEQRTLELFGYTSDMLSKGSGKTIIRICDKCGRYDEIIFNSYIRAKNSNLCNSCGRHGKNHPNWQGGKITLTCKICGNKYKVKYSQRDSKFCSHKCSIKYHTGSNHPMWQGGKKTLICEYCYKEFKVTPALKNQRFCSKKCYGKYNRNENNSNYKQKIILMCQQCKKEFEVLPSGKNSKFCSTKCHGEWKSINQFGKNHPAWKGGIANQKYCKLFSEKFKQLIRNHYHNKCYLCNKSKEDNGKNLSVHHVNYNKNCLCGSSCEFVILCKSCHSKTNFNRQMWEDLIMCMLYPERYFMVNL